MDAAFGMINERSLHPQQRPQRPAGSPQAAQSRDWVVAELNSGTACEDVIATAPCGTVYAIEVKNTAAITTAHRKQAIEQAKERKAAWMLMSKIAGTSEWLIQRQHQSAVVWRADA